MIKFNTNYTAIICAVLLSASTYANANSITNPNFQDSNVSVGNYLYAGQSVMAIPWGFTGASGLANQSVYWNANNQLGLYAFVQMGATNDASISQVIYTSATQFQIKFSAAQRQYNGEIGTIDVYLDNQLILNDLSPGASFEETTVDASGLPLDAHILTFRADGKNVVDATVFIKDIQLEVIQ